MAWYRNPSRRWLLRIIGIVVLLISWRAGVSLAALVHRRVGEPTAIAYLLAFVTFCCASIGSALLFIGHHLFDRVEISERWSSKPTRETGRGDDMMAER